MYRRPGIRPDYSERALERRRRPWQFTWPFTIVEVLFFLALAGLIAMLVWDQWINPCVSYGPEKTTWELVSCGDNCLMPVERRYRECLKRTR